ncbi:MAG: NAD-dependent epimerase/dehydratase family protein [bacterium]|jgi:nucleoside-diphosphate-sugar epimerase|nr:NAD-dependent epimerase/dehydratase family protein [bacterium]
MVIPIENPKTYNVLVTGGAGYVGSELVPKLLSAGHKVTVLDLFLFGEHVFDHLGHHPNLKVIRGDIRQLDTVIEALEGCNVVIHLACISNDPSFELDPELGKSINFDAFLPLVKAAKLSGVKRFIFVSSSSVYGIKHEPNVTETLPLEPLTDYSFYKAECEKVLEAEREPGFVTVTLRPATVCGYSRRLRLDLTVNILTNHALNRDMITVFGGSQKRPNINIEDMTDLYVNCLTYPADMIDGQVFNAGYENHTVAQLAEIVQAVVHKEMGRSIDIVTTPSDDLRSYHISSEKITRKLGFVPRYSIEDAVLSLIRAFSSGKIPQPLTNPVYFNVKTMQAVNW